jgi:hypothetical protein
MHILFVHKLMNEKYEFWMPQCSMKLTWICFGLLVKHILFPKTSQNQLSVSLTFPPKSAPLDLKQNYSNRINKK